jgi:general secretion pathway protein E
MQDPRFLAELLKRAGEVEPARVDHALALLEDDGRDEHLAAAIVRRGFADEATIARSLARELEFPLLLEIRHEALPFQWLEAIAFDLAYARRNRLVPVDVRDDAVTVAVADPLNTVAIDDMRSLLGRAVDVAIATPTAILDAVSFLQTQLRGKGDNLRGEAPDGKGEREERTELLEEENDAEIIRWVNELFIEAIKDRATDIHIQPEAADVAIRYRIDGELRRVRTVPKRFLPRIVARIKIWSTLDIAERRLPQDGRIGFRLAGKDVDIRVSTIPVAHDGERVVLRILNKSSIGLELTDLGFAPDRLEAMQRLVACPGGIVLVTGPTGSGKTTTLYACLNQLNQPNVNILTTEDPIEYDLAGVSQMQVTPAIGLTFAACLRAFLRQDPDVIMVGEIRDRETAEVAVQASLTGHLVLSTIHTRDAAGAVTRLAEMGIEGFHLASTLEGALAQRLVRVLCPSCKRPRPLVDADLARMGVDRARLAERLARGRTRYGEGAFGGSVAGDVARAIVRGERAVVYEPAGCGACRGAGYHGRTGLYELLLMSDAIRPLVLERRDASTIRRAAVREGMDTLRDDGVRKVLEGQTSIEEVIAATHGE